MAKNRIKKAEMMMVANQLNLFLDPPIPVGTGVTAAELMNDIQSVIDDNLITVADPLSDEAWGILDRVFGLLRLNRNDTVDDRKWRQKKNRYQTRLSLERGYYTTGAALIECFCRKKEWDKDDLIVEANRFLQYNSPHRSECNQANELWRRVRSMLVIMDIIRVHGNVVTVSEWFWRRKRKIMANVAQLGDIPLR